MSDRLMTIREMSDQFKVSLRLLRFYEEKELLFPIRRGTQRRFTKRDRARLKLILKGKTYGFPLEEMRTLLNLYDEGKKEQQLAEVYQAALPHLATLKQTRRRLDETIADLERCMCDCFEQIESQNRKKCAIA